MKSVLKFALALLALWFVFGITAWIFKKVFFFALIGGAVYLIYRLFFSPTLSDAQSEQQA